MSHYCNNDMYRNLFNKIYDNYSTIEDNSLYIKINTIEQNLNKIFNMEIENNFFQFNQKLLQIQNDLEKILRENLKHKDFNNELTGNNSDLVFIEKDDIIEIKKETNINDMFFSIFNQIKKIHEMTKPPEHSSKLILIK
jgi:hypothetical protein